MGRKVDWTLKPKKGPGRKSKKQPAPTFAALDTVTAKSIKKPLRPVKATKPLARVDQSHPESDDGTTLPHVISKDKFQNQPRRTPKAEKKIKRLHYIRQRVTKKNILTMNLIRKLYSTVNNQTTVMKKEAKVEMN